MSAIPVVPVSFVDTSLPIAQHLFQYVNDADVVTSYIPITTCRSYILLIDNLIVNCFYQHTDLSCLPYLDRTVSDLI